ncbi:uncharacterized protein HMPREF1541_04117 [Cyphellophora europaea CBS 101466]|uniref:Uncharacterized protein n=1 Tax=Cyphellophora europaea (strain CBS 101466) TaxID=1220924 RepID=W2S0A8_CYPE1|nr:uncharacterized protein HMPREF1541_04117 [Cyphellophora europaea CBS 101466]ETN42176.1 hypothetical protein HMPREF1541_04117 [Cyphellophora europaea CBS 101466]
MVQHDSKSCIWSAIYVQAYHICWDRIQLAGNQPECPEWTVSESGHSPSPTRLTVKTGVTLCYGRCTLPLAWTSYPSLSAPG